MRRVGALDVASRGGGGGQGARGGGSFARGESERAREAYTEALAHVGAEERTTRGPDGSFVDRSSVDADDGGRADVDVLAAACLSQPPARACLTRPKASRGDRGLRRRARDRSCVRQGVRASGERAEAVGELEGALEDY